MRQSSDHLLAHAIFVDPFLKIRYLVLTQKSLNTYLIIYLNNQIILFSTVLSILNSRNQDKFFSVFVSFLIFFLLLIVIRMIFLY